MSKENQLTEEKEIPETEASYEEVEGGNVEEGNTDVGLSGIQAIIRDHKNNLIIAAGLILVAIVYFVMFAGSSPEKEDEAGNAIFQAVRYFEEDSLSLALNGDGNNAGLLELVSEYSGTKTGNLCNFYIGAIYLRQGKLEDAFTYFKEVNKEDNFISASAYGAMGGISEDQGDLEKAAGYYEKAAGILKNAHTTPYYLQQAARCYFQAESHSAALRLYKQVRDEYPASQEAQNVEKYIALLSSED